MNTIKPKYYDRVTPEGHPDEMPEPRRTTRPAEQQETTAEHSPEWKLENQSQNGHLGDYCDLHTCIKYPGGIMRVSQRIHDSAEGYKEGQNRAAYIVKACNEYPKLLAALKQFTECNLTEENCASFEVANKRIRNLARTAIANASKPADPFTDEKLHEMGCSYDREQIDGGE